MRWVDALGLPSGALVLEVGCGAGNATLALVRKGFHVVATDPVAQMLSLARARVRAAGLDDRVAFAYVDAHSLAFPDGIFQLVLALGVLPWLHSPGEAVGEMARVLGRADFVILSADNRLRLNHLFDPRLSPLGAPARRSVRRLRSFPPPDKSVPVMHAPGEVRAMLRTAGLAVQAEATCGFAPFTLFGQPVFGEPVGARLDGWLQRSADAGMPLVNRLGAHYLACCSRSVCAL
jgi:SAM-dependent methyltransferase